MGTTSLEGGSLNGHGRRGRCRVVRRIVLPQGPVSPGQVLLQPHRESRLPRTGSAGQVGGVRKGRREEGSHQIRRQWGIAAPSAEKAAWNRDLGGW